MHELLVSVLQHRDLSKAGELFKVRDWDIVNDLDKALSQLQLIFSSRTYSSDQNSQSVVEICLARITSAIRETKTIERYARGLVEMLEACLAHKLQAETPHAKIASDLLSCLFLHYETKGVMTVAIPAAVQALRKGNGDLVRNTSSYLALAAIHNAKLIANYAVQIIDSITIGNYSLVRVLPQIYPENREEVHAHLACLIGVLDECDPAEKMSLLQLCSLIANNKPELLVPHVAKLSLCLSTLNTCSAVLHIFLSFVTSGLTHTLCDHLSALKQTADVHASSNMASVARIIAAIARSKKSSAQECVSYLVVQCYRADSSTLPTIMKSIESISEVYPEYVQPFLGEMQKLADDSNNANARSVHKRIRDYCSDDEATRIRIRTPSSSERITVIPVNDYCSKESLSSQKFYPNAVTSTGSSSQPKSNNTIKATAATTGMAKFVVTGKNVTATYGSGNSVNSNLSRPKSRSHGNLSNSKRQLTTITISKDLLRPQPCSPKETRGRTPDKQSSADSGVNGDLLPNATMDTVTGEIPPRRPLIRMGHSPAVKRHVNSAAMHNRNSLFVLGTSADYQVQYINSKGRIRVNPAKSGSLLDSPLIARADKLTGSHVVTTFYPNRSITQRTGSGSTLTVEQSTPSVDPGGAAESVYALTRDAQTQSPLMLHTNSARLRTDTSQTNSRHTSENLSKHGSILQQLQMQEYELQRNKGCDAIKQFCEKHKDKIKQFAADFCTRYPIPTQCTVEESGHKQRIRVHFNCQERGEHCLYTNATYFAFKTKLAHVWLHLMFLHLQAQSAVTLDRNNEQVQQLRCCWDNVQQTVTKNMSFIALVTSAFPSARDQQTLLKELQTSRYFDLFAFNAAKTRWACFPCNHPHKVQDFLKLNPNNPLIEGQLKEKKGRWKLFKRWQTRYFTLSGASLSYREDQYQSNNPIIDLRSIKSVKSVSKRKGRRTLPKAFEIFTQDDVTSYVLKAKDRKNAEEWFQCLQIAIAQAHKEPQFEVSAL